MDTEYLLFGLQIVFNFLILFAPIIVTMIAFPDQVDRTQKDQNGALCNLHKPEERDPRYWDYNQIYGIILLIFWVLGNLKVCGGKAIIELLYLPSVLKGPFYTFGIDVPSWILSYDTCN